MRNLSVDLETYSSIDLAKSGVYRYCESPDFEILLFGYSIDGGEVKVIDLASGESLPKQIKEAILDDGVTKSAFNAQFERICLSRYLGKWLKPDSWKCTMIWSAYMGLPLSLVGAGAVLGLEKQKLEGGKDLIRYFCKPCKPTKANGQRTRNLPQHAPDKWVEFKAYNLRDVEAELEIQKRLAKFPVPDEEWQNYILDQEINDRGILLDVDLVHEAIQLDERARSELMQTMKKVTGLENPNSVAQLKIWLSARGVETENLDKAAVEVLLNEATGEVREVLECRQALAKSSVKKYVAMENAVCYDGRARGLLQFYGANRTGRFAGRLIQVQNLPRNDLQDLNEARGLVKTGNFEMVEALYDSVLPLLSELIRTAFIPKPGCRFIVADFSAIEARVIAWLAGEKWRNDVFAGHGKIYEASASQMFGVPLEQITKDSPLRQKGKIAELALGYGGSVGALKAMGALDMGLSEDELKPLVDVWRTSNPNIIRLWRAVDKAALTAVRERTRTQTHGIVFDWRSGMLFMTLPSGRNLAYVKPRIGTNRFGSDSITFEGVGNAKKWERIETYGAKLVENIVQAISRDILCYGMRRLNDLGLPIVMHVHDEVVIEVREGVSVDEVCREMSKSPPWAEGLLLRADGFECSFYQKD
jgi:DNA polymerase